MRVLLVAAALLALTAATAGQDQRFDRWDTMRDPRFQWDPDERAVLGFSIRASSSARAALDDAEAALDAGDSREAARQLLAVVDRYGSDLLQVAGSSANAARWVGTAEWALYLLVSRMPRNVLEELASPDDRQLLATATAWRELDQLHRLSVRLEVLPEGRRAAAVLARLLTERGEWEAARVAARRASHLGAPVELALPEPSAAPDVQPTPSLPPLLDPAWTSPLTIEELARKPAQNPFTGRFGHYEAPFAPVLPVVGDGVVYTADSISITARDLISGRSVWHHTGPVEEVDVLGTDDVWFDFGIYASYRRSRAISPYQCAWPTLTDDLVIASVQAVEPIHDLDEFESYPINHPLPRRRLVAVARGTGELVWRQERPALGPDAFVNRFDVSSPVAIEGGVVYASGSVTEGAINAYIAAFDVQTGDLLWNTLLCSGQQELTMFNRPFQEHVVSPVLLEDGSLYFSTNLGVVACVDAWSGRVRWLRAYEVIARESARQVAPDTARDVNWLNRPPFIEDGVLFVAPLDSETLLALDAQTGRAIYGIPHAGSNYRIVRHQVVPTGLGHVILVTDSGTEGYDADSGAMLWDHEPFDPEDRVKGAATLVGDVLLVPCDERLVAVDVRTGLLRADMVRPWSSKTPGADWIQRVVTAGPVTLLVDGKQLFATVDVEAVLRSASLLADESPQALMQLAELELNGGFYGHARARFDQLLDLGDRSFTDRAWSGRLEAVLRAARADDDVASWQELLDVATPSELMVLAPEALSALHRLGVGPALVEWLGRLMDADPGAMIAFGPELPQPVALLYARYRLPFERPETQVAILQGLVEADPPALWSGVAVREEARRRIDVLLEEHGRGLYDAFEQRAREELDATGNLAPVAERFPNARIVADARITVLQDLLEDGRARDVLAASTLAAGGSALLELRARAAEALGESEYADFVLGRASWTRERLATLPPDGGGLLALELHDRYTVKFGRVTGRATGAYAGSAVGMVESLGELFLIDTVTGRVRWSGRAMPGGVTSLSSTVAFHLEDDVLVARGNSTVQVMALEDGRTLWSRALPGTAIDTLVIDGLVLALQKFGSSSYRLDAFGLRSGADACQVEIPGARSAELVSIGPYVVVHARSRVGSDGRTQDAQIFVIDMARGAIASASPISDGLSLVSTLDEPPVALFSGRLGGTSQARMVAWSPQSTSILWTEDTDGSSAFPTVPGRFAYSIVRTLEGRRRAELIVPVDARTGVLPVPEGAPIADRPRGQDAGPASQIVMLDPDPDHRNRVIVLDGETAQVRYVQEFERPLSGSVRVFHGDDGFVLVSESYDGPRTTWVWVVRGEDGGQRYSIGLDDLRRRVEADVQLVDGAVLLATGGTVWIIRSGKR